MGRLSRTIRSVGFRRLIVSAFLGFCLVFLVSWVIDGHAEMFPLSRSSGPHIRTHQIIHWRTSGNDRLVTLIDEFGGYANVYTEWCSPDLYEVIVRLYPHRLESATLPSWCVDNWQAYTRPSRDPNESYYGEVAVGWPAYALSNRFQGHPTATGTWHNALVLPISWIPGINSSSDATLPVRILWPGFLFNALCYAIIMYIVLSILHTLRTLHRRLTNRCAACGYSLDNLTTDICPECGGAVRPRSQDDRTNNTETAAKTRSF